MQKILTNKIEKDFKELLILSSIKWTISIQCFF